MAVANVGFALLQGNSLLHALIEGSIVAVFAICATWARARLQLAAGLVAGGLMVACAVFVHLADGVIEAHFLFFIMLLVLTIYEEWIPFLVAALFVLVEHGVVGVIDPHAVYNHADAIANPWLWALIHAGFVSAAGVAGITAWALNERTRKELLAATRRAQASERSLDEAQRLAQIGSYEVDLGTRDFRLSAMLIELLELDQDGGRPSVGDFLQRVHPEDRNGLADALDGGIEHGMQIDHRYRLIRSDDSERVIHSLGNRVVDPVNGTVKLSGTCQDITDRARAAELIERARDDAVEASRRKSEFVAIMSHEIRTPLNGVLGMTDLLRDGELSAAQRQQADILWESATALLRIVNDVLDFSKVEAGEMAVEEVDFDLWGGVERVAAVLSSQAEQKGLSWDLEIDPAVPQWVRGDASRLRQILLNILSNAVKFTERGGVEMRVAVAGPGELCFQVIDTGIGVSADAQADIFHPYRQAEASTTRRFGGTGLGLSISRQLVELMHGRIEVESKLGEGSKFVVHLPLPAVEAKRQESRTRGITPPMAAESSRALVVDDAPVNQLVASAMLKRLGYQTDLAGNGAEALAAVERVGYDVILMDCLMPVMDGYTATKKIRALSGANAQVPIVALTASAMIGDREKCLSSGMDDYLAKPLDHDRLADVLRSCVSRGEDSTAGRVDAEPDS
jgi:signal transduction histidine kinase/CheY-like chemotaxis protein